MLAYYGLQRVPTAAEIEDVKKMREEVDCANRLKDEVYFFLEFLLILLMNFIEYLSLQALSKCASYEDLMISKGITRREMRGVVEDIVSADQLMTRVNPGKKRKATPAISTAENPVKLPADYRQHPFAIHPSGFWIREMGGDHIGSALRGNDGKKRK